MMWKQFKNSFLAHFKSTFREKQVWFWSIAFPVLLMVIFLTIFGGAAESNDDFEAKMAVVMEEETPLAEQMLQMLKSIPVLSWHSDQPIAREEAEQLVKDKKIDGAVILPAANAHQVELWMNQEQQNSMTAQVLHGLLDQALIVPANFALANIQPQIRLAADYLTNSDRSLTYTDFLLTGMIALSLAQSGLFGMMGLVEMRRNGLMRRLKMTPMKMSMFGMGDILVRFILAAIQITILTLIGVLLYGANLQIHVWSFLIIFITGTLSFAGIGYMIASYSKSIESYSAIANLASFLMMFLSGIFFDVNSLPSYVRPIAEVLPLTYFSQGIRDSMVYGIGLFDSSIWVNTGIMAAWGVLTFLIGLKLYGGKKDLARAG